MVNLKMHYNNIMEVQGMVTNGKMVQQGHFLSQSNLKGKWAIDSQGDVRNAKFEKLLPEIN